ncbi:MAG: ComEC/Rec2 family competence protein [Gemmataceae bacterium]|nr:ComEC/Rec2 family competence protein [Gemmataceae bacterium]
MLEALPTPSAPPPWREFVRAPLVPFALAATTGLIVDRFAGPPLALAFLAAALGLIAGWAARVPIGFWLAVAGLAAAHHHTHRNVFPTDDIGRFLGEQPAVARVRGLLDRPPVVRRSDTDLFGPARRVDRATTILDATELADGAGGWIPVSGRLRLTIERIVGAADRPPFDALRVGDEIEATGLLSRPSPPGNPGEWDFAEHLLDERIRGELRCVKADDAVARLDDRGRRWAVLARLHGHFTRLLDDTLPPREAALARALLLGDGSAMDRDEWDAFARTGVLHVLAISGQHLIILAGFVWWTLRLVGVRRRTGALAVVALVVGYAILTGLRPSAARAAIMVAVACGGLLLRRPVHRANTFALAWLAVLAWNPTDPFTTGCQLSFLSVFVLMWGTVRWFAPKEPTPMEQLLAESRSTFEKLLRAALRAALVWYGITFVLTVTNAPLVMLRQNVVPPAGLVLGPPLILLTSIAMLAGFLLLIVGSIPPLGFVVGAGLSWCDSLVRFADALPGASVYVPTPSVWWTVAFYAILVAYILLADRRFLYLSLAWLGLGLVGLPRPATDELRVTFLAVGHGGCTVLELPDGRTFLYDAGTMAGPDAMRRIIAPFLWNRGIARVDELFLSHADLDHFNGVTELFHRFPVGQVTMTPSFATKPTPEVAEVLLAIRERKIPSRIASAGDRFAAGEVMLDVLHPPREGPDGAENERSLVLNVKHGNHSILLTGDLEKAGAVRVLGLPPVPCDVLMAPHHGSRAAFSPELVRWCSPAFVAVTRGNRSESAVRPGDAGGAPVWDTWTSGAITLRSNPTGLTAESFRRAERLVVKRGK